MKIKAVEFEVFQRCFRVCYYTNIHSAQGLSIGEKYLIHQFNKSNFDQQLKYVLVGLEAMK